MNIRLSLFIPFMVLALSACSKSNGSGGSAGGAGNDNFVRSVLAITDSTAEDTEPVDVETLVPSNPEDSEPQVLS